MSSTSSTAASPSDMATGNEEIEEERRLLYVAMTRAKDTLLLVVPQRFYMRTQAKRGDKHVYAARTRFISPDCWPFRDAVVADGRPLAMQQAAASNHRRSGGPHARHVARHRHVRRGSRFSTPTKLQTGDLAVCLGAEWTKGALPG